MPKKTLSSLYKKALVTGASSGLGRAFAEMLAQEGLDVWATSRDPSAIPSTHKIHPLKLDLLDVKSVGNLVKQINEDELTFDLLINNAGAGAFYSFEAFPEALADSQIDLLFRNPIQLTQAIYKKMHQANKGALINVSSMGGDYPIPYMSLYNAGKAGLSAFSKSLMLETQKVLIIDLKPGDFNTPFNARNAHNKDLTRNEQAAFDSMDQRMHSHPDASIAAKQLRKILLNNKSGSFYIGAFWQTKALPFLAKWASRPLILKFLRKYYNLP